MKLPPDIRKWPADWLYEFHERLSIMLDSHIPEPEARIAAEADVRRRADTGELF